jgi:hypothetical protein
LFICRVLSVPKKVDWEPVFKDYMDGMNVPGLAAKYQVSDRSIERQMSAGGWADIRKAAKLTGQKVVEFAKPEKKPKAKEAISERYPQGVATPATVPVNYRTSPPKRDRKPEELDMQEMLTTAIASMSGYAAAGAEEPPSPDRAASAMARLIETYRKHYPPTMEDAVKWVVGLPGFDPLQFAKLLREYCAQQQRA